MKFAKVVTKLLNESYSNAGYFIHATSSKYRNSINAKGLIPADVSKSAHYDQDTKKYLEYDKPGIFATFIGIQLDVYDIKNIKNKVYMVPSTGFDEYEDYDELVIKNKKIKSKDDANLELNRLRRFFGKYDVWLIDNNIAKVNWIKDEHGLGNDFLGDADMNSFYTTSKISRNSIELIVANGVNLKFENK